jgi:hypothetical protein
MATSANDDQFGEVSELDGSYTPPATVGEAFAEALKMFREYQIAYRNSENLNPLRLVLVETPLAQWGIATGLACGDSSFVNLLPQAKQDEIKERIRAIDRELLMRVSARWESSTNPETETWMMTESLRNLHDRKRFC